MPDEQTPAPPRIKPPAEHSLKRWHCFRDEEGRLYVADWGGPRHGWHGGWNGKLDINADDFDEWTYLGPVEFPGVPH